MVRCYQGHIARPVAALFNGEYSIYAVIAPIVAHAYWTFSLHLYYARTTVIQDGVVIFHYHLLIPYNGVVNRISNLPYLFPTIQIVIVLFTWALQVPTAADTLNAGVITIEHDESQQQVAAYTLRVLEDAIAEFEPLLPIGEGPIHIKIIAVADEFEGYVAHFAGLTVSGLARPGESLIIVKAPRLTMPSSDYAGTLRHELVHLLVYRNVNPAFIPIWLNEGIAMSLANEFRWQAMFSVARMFIQGRIIPYHKLDNAFVLPTGQEQFGDAYAQALSMTRHLRNRLGEDLFWEMVRNMKHRPFPKALHETTGMTLQQFWAEYERSLWKYAAVATMASGFFFQPAAILVILAYLRRRRIAKKLYQRWEKEEEEEAREVGRIVYWEEFVEDADAWKGESQDDEEERW
jgi:hypothetical protein